MDEVMTELSPPVPTTEEGSRLPILWRATDEKFVRRLPAPDGRAEFVFFAFMLDLIPPVDNAEWARMRPTVESTVYAEVMALGQKDRSLLPAASQNYRPSGFHGKCCILGNMNWTAKTWAWMLVDFNRHDPRGGPNPTKVSWTYWWNGAAPLLKYEWGPFASFTDANRYRIKIHYTDAGDDWGSGMWFDPISMV